MREAMLYERRDGGQVACRLCAQACVLDAGARGSCGVRYNHEGSLRSAVFGKAAALNLDPIEKKPLFHFLPGTPSLSLGTIGCNFRCRFCQNWEISQAAVDGPAEFRGHSLTPQAIVEHCAAQGLPSISFTYNEPTVFFEYAFDTARLAQAKRIRSVFVTNGFLSRPALQTIAPYLSALNIDLKSARDGFYQEYCGARLGPVLDTIRLARELGLWVEVTTLVIPGLNDEEDELAQTAGLIAAIDPVIPWHVTAFHPDYQLTGLPLTGAESLCRACDLGRQAGLAFVYVGNLHDDQRTATWCPQCDALLIRRSWYAQLAHLVDGRCAKCGAAIPGVWA